MSERLRPADISTLKLAIFDLDGTLIDPKVDIFLQHTLETLPQFGYPDITLEQLSDYYRNFNIWGFVPETQREHFETRFWEALNKRHLQEPEPVQGAHELLDALLTRGIRIAIATARDTLPDDLRRELSACGLMNYIDVVTTRGISSEKHWHDKTAQILEACQHAKISPDSAFMAGDTPSDIISARNVNIGAAIGVLSGGIDETLLIQSGAHLVLPTIFDLIEHLK